jgi:hypothetical protein
MKHFTANSFHKSYDFYNLQFTTNNTEKMIKLFEKSYAVSTGN